jgi:sugar-phosphatase
VTVHRAQALGHSDGRDLPRSLTLLLDGNHAEISCRGVLFDMDGVLVESMAVVFRHLRQWAAAHGLDPDRVIEISHGLTNTDLVRAVAPWLDSGREAELMVRREISDIREIRAGAGAMTLMAALPSASWAVVTSADRQVAHARLKAAGITRPKILISASDIERGKPDPQGYLLAAERMCVDPGECIVIEDAPAGIAAARAAGCRVIALAGTVDPGLLDGDFVVPSLAAVSALVRSA